MDSDAIRTPGSARLKRNLDSEAVDLALQGEWERATEVNKAILELFPNEVEAMNRLVKALIELGSYLEARVVLDRVCEAAPYNNIAKKNRARLDQLTASPGVGKPAKKTAGEPRVVPRIFIEETGKSSTTVLRNPGGNRGVAHVSPSDRVVLSPEKNTVTVRTLDGQLLGQVEPRLGKRLAGLMDGGNRYTAAIVSVNEDGVSVIIQETIKHRSLQDICSFPAKAPATGARSKEAPLKGAVSEDEDEDLLSPYEALARSGGEEDVDDDDEEENIIVEDELDTGWSEDE